MDSENKTPILILGTGDIARTALDIALKLDILVYGYLAAEEDTETSEINDILVIAGLGSRDAETLLGDSKMKLVLAERDIDNRRLMVETISGKEPELITLAHPSTEISDYAKIGKGNLIENGVTIGPNAAVGSYSLIGSQVYIGPDVLIDDFCTLQAGVKVGAGAQIEEGVFLGMGAVILPGITIGKGSLISPGSVVMQDVPEESQAFGNPAQIAD